jgi:L-asparaginase / beta-aspartyl-peptidase
MTRSLFIVSGVLIFLLTIWGCEQNSSQQKEWALALHGGAGTISQDLPDSIRQQYYDGLEQALAIGADVLRNGGSALDAVEATVRDLEDNRLFNAGRGSVFTSEGKHELDAAIMDGSTLAAGALTGLTTVRHPISLARHVKENSRHIFFSGHGAEEYADQTDVERVENDFFHTQRRYEQWQRAQEQAHLNAEDSAAPDAGEKTIYDWIEDLKFGTVGAVALDREGKLAAATSTGGMTNKQFGRVGDVPIIGSGTFANHVAAISATGWGEQIMRNVSANTIANYMEFNGASLDRAMYFVLSQRLDPGDAGFIGVDRHGNLSMQMNTGGMFRASLDSEGNKVVMIWEDE